MLEIEITETNIVEKGVEVYARAWRDGVQIGFGRDGSVDIERFRFFNPPVLVPDGTKTLVTETPEGSDREFSYEVDNYKEDPEEAILQALTDTINKVEKFDDSNIQSGKVGNTTSTFFPTVDGYARYVGSALSWSSLETANGNSSSVTGSTIEFLRISSGSNGTEFDVNARTFFVFDTSAIADTDDIDSATFSVYGTGKTDEFLTTIPDITIAEGTLASEATVANGDYQGTYSNQTKLTDTDITFAGWSTSGYNDFALNASGLAIVNKTGNTVIGGRNTADGLGGSDPVATAGFKEFIINSYTVDQTGTSNDPKLVVVHSEGATDFPLLVSTLSLTATANAIDFSRGYKLVVETASSVMAFGNVIFDISKRIVVSTLNLAVSLKNISFITPNNWKNISKSVTTWRNRDRS